MPVAVTKAGAGRLAGAGITRNISSTGVLFTALSEPDLGSPIEYLITLDAVEGKPVHIRCVGKVVRCERVPAAGGMRPGYHVAATLERYEFVRSA